MKTKVKISPSDQISYYVYRASRHPHQGVSFTYVSPFKSLSRENPEGCPVSALASAFMMWINEDRLYPLAMTRDVWLQGALKATMTWLPRSTYDEVMSLVLTHFKEINHPLLPVFVAAMIGVHE